MQPFEHAGLVRAERAAALQHERDRLVRQRARGGRCAGLVMQVRRIDGLLFGAGVRLHCMNQPWLTMNDWPVSAALGKADRNSTVCATS